jgi:hypothetical protein
VRLPACFALKTQIATHIYKSLQHDRQSEKKLEKRARGLVIRWEVPHSIGIFWNEKVEAHKTLVSGPKSEHKNPTTYIPIVILKLDVKLS